MQVFSMHRFDYEMIASAVDPAQAAGRDIELPPDAQRAIALATLLKQDRTLQAYLRLGTVSKAWQHWLQGAKLANNPRSP